MEWHKGRPIRKRTAKESIIKKILVTHLENESKIYIYLKIIINCRGTLSYVEILNYQEAKKINRIHRGFAIVISKEQFESIMALFKDPKLLTEYLKSEKLLNKRNYKLQREPL